MPLKSDEKARLEEKAYELRLLTLETVIWAGSGHIGGALSAMDILTILYHKYLKHDPKRPDWPERDRFICSKGHIGVGLAPVLADRGYFEKLLLKEYNHTGSPLGMHLDSSKVPGVEASTGSLGHGLAIGLGMAMGARLRKESWRTFVLLGDGECDEGAVWEAAMAAAHFTATNLIAIVDRNSCMIDGPTEDVMRLEPLADKWRSFGWQVAEVNGHDLDDLAKGIEKGISSQDKPVVVIADTVKGEGIDFIADDYRWHYGSFDAEKAAMARASLGRHLAMRMERVGASSCATEA